MEILNRGRGAGKSHALALWQLEDPVNRRIVSTYPFPPLYQELGVSTAHVLSYKQASEGRLRGYYGAVGFDNFDGWLRNTISNELHVDVFRTDDSTILVTTMAESELLPGPTMIPASPDYAAKVIDWVKENWPDAAWREFLGEKAEPLLGVVTPEKEEAVSTEAPAKKKLYNLTYGEYVAGYGRVTSIVELDLPGQITVTFKSEGRVTTVTAGQDAEI
jgi:hypothetical protein